MPREIAGEFLLALWFCCGFDKAGFSHANRVENAKLSWPLTMLAAMTRIALEVMR